MLNSKQLLALIERRCKGAKWNKETEEQNNNTRGINHYNSQILAYEELIDTIKKSMEE